MSAVLRRPTEILLRNGVTPELHLLLSLKQFITPVLLQAHGTVMRCYVHTPFHPLRKRSWLQDVLQKIHAICVAAAAAAGGDRVYKASPSALAQAQLFACIWILLFEFKEYRSYRRRARSWWGQVDCCTVSTADLQRVQTQQGAHFAFTRRLVQCRSSGCSALTAAYHAMFKFCGSSCQTG